MTPGNLSICCSGGRPGEQIQESGHSSCCSAVLYALWINLSLGHLSHVHLLCNGIDARTCEATVGHILLQQIENTRSKIF